MDVFLGILAFIFAILNIILFFKIWGMTNDISQIKAKYIDLKVTPSPIEVKYFTLKELAGAEEAKKLLVQAVLEDVEKKVKSLSSEEEINKIVKHITVNYSPLLNDAGLNGITFDELKKYIEKKNKAIPSFFKIDEDILYRRNSQLWRGTLKAVNADKGVCIILTKNGEEIQVSVKDCEEASPK